MSISGCSLLDLRLDLQRRALRHDEDPDIGDVLPDADCSGLVSLSASLTKIDQSLRLNSSALVRPESVSFQLIHNILKLSCRLQ